MPFREVAGSAPTAPTPRISASPAVVRVEELLRAGDSAEAVLFAYQAAEADVRRAFGMNLPRQWTHREFLHRYMRRDMGRVALLLPQLYALFEPVRYGTARDVPTAELTDVVRSLYAEPALRRPLPPTPEAAPEPSPPTPERPRFGRRRALRVNVPEPP